MRWPVFAVFGFAAVVIQQSLADTFLLRELWYIKPDFVACLVVFISLFASRMAALWGAWLLGLAIDLAPQSNEGQEHLLGIYALGYVAGAYAVVQMRTMVFRRRALTVGFLTVVCVVAVSLVGVMLLAIRSWYPDAVSYGPLSDFGRRLLIALYSGVIGIPVGWALMKSLPLWGFQPQGPRRGW